MIKYNKGMDFGEFRDSINEKWQKSLLRLCWCGFVVVFVFEFVVFLAYLKNNSITASIDRYLLLRLILPSGCNFLASIAATIVFYSNRFKVSQKNLYISICVCVLAASISICHNYFKFVLAAIGLPIMICAVFADRRILIATLHICLAVFAASLLTLWFDDRRLPFVDYMATAVSAFFYLALVYVVAKSILSYQSKQIDFVYSSSQRQAELLSELNIEPFTKLYNRSALDEAMSAYLRSFNLGIAVPCMVLIDMDNFKQVNKLYGRQHGDEVLLRISQVIKENMGGIRKAFRYGGEEFVMLFVNETETQVREVVDNIRDTFAEEKFDFADDRSFTFSAGIAFLQRGWDETTWFSAADNAVYSEKKAKDGSVEQFAK